MRLSPDLPIRLQIDSYFHRSRILDDNPLNCDCSIASLWRKDGDRRIVSSESSNNWECYRDPPIRLTDSRYLFEDCSASEWYNIIFVVGGVTVVNHKRTSLILVLGVNMYIGHRTYMTFRTMTTTIVTIPDDDDDDDVETRWLQEIPFSKELTDNYCALR